MKPGATFERAYKLMADYKAHEDDCERLNMSYDSIIIVHGTYKKTFDL